MPRRRCELAVLVAAVLGCSAARPGASEEPLVEDASVRDAPRAETAIFAHTATALYRVDPVSLDIAKVGDFAFADVPEEITDVAIDRSGLLLGISFSSVYRIDPLTAVATKRASGLLGGFNGLSFVPAAVAGTTGDDVLVATRLADDAVIRIDPFTGDTSPLGNMQTAVSSGDLVSVDGLGTLLTADTGNGTPDRLVVLADETFTAAPIGTSIGFAEIWGLAYWDDRLVGFTHAGELITIDVTTGIGTLVHRDGPAWWGAAVTTRAPVAAP